MEILNQGTLVLFFLLAIQFELFIWLGGKFFSGIKYKTVNEYVKKAVGRLILFFACAFIISVVIYFLTMSIVALVNGLDFNTFMAQILKTDIKGFLIGAGSGYIFGSLIFFYFQWTDALKREQKLKEEKLIFQYETLKNQVNPHFLFNSLNTLSSLVSRDVSLSEKYIQKLSSIYRYILENKDHDHISLKEELEFVQDYFYLQKVRDDGKIDLEIQSTDPERYEILPISLQLLVENAFKHNVATKEEPLKIVIELLEQQKAIAVVNRLRPKTLIESSSRLGLSNLSERNKLITGKDIEVIKSNEEFKVIVPLKNKKDEGTDN
jgi:sensor histidine kinase YesM